jgi:hypothetical protein
LVIALAFIMASNLLGRDHPTLVDTYTLELIEKLEQKFHDTPEVTAQISILPPYR